MRGQGSKNQRDGAQTERMVAKHLRPVWPEADRRLREGRSDDQGDLDGVPFTTVQIKRSKEYRIQEWVAATVKQREAAGNPFCLLIHRRMYTPVGKWDAYMPIWQLTGTHQEAEQEAWSWVRLELDTAVIRLLALIYERERSR